MVGSEYCAAFPIDTLATLNIRRVFQDQHVYQLAILGCAAVLCCMYLGSWIVRTGAIGAACIRRTNIVQQPPRSQEATAAFRRDLPRRPTPAIIVAFVDSRDGEGINQPGSVA